MILQGKVKRVIELHPMRKCLYVIPLKITENLLASNIGFALGTPIKIRSFLRRLKVVYNFGTNTVRSLDALT